MFKKFKEEIKNKFSFREMGFYTVDLYSA